MSCCLGTVSFTVTMLHASIQHACYPQLHAFLGGYVYQIQGLKRARWHQLRLPAPAKDDYHVTEVALPFLGIGKQDLPVHSQCPQSLQTKHLNLGAPLRVSLAVWNSHCKQ